MRSTETFQSANRQTLFAFHWAAEQMAQDSECFSDIDSEGRAADLARRD